MTADPYRLSLAVAAAALAGSLLAGCGSRAAENAAPPPPTVGAAPVLVQPVSAWDEFNGRIEATEVVELRPRVSGTIERVHYAEGQDVKKGEVLFTIDDRSYRAELARAEAELARAQTRAELARSEAARAKKLTDQQAIATEAWEQRRAAAAQAEADVRAAQAALDQARLNLEWTRVRAPIASRTGRARVTAGNLVSAGDGAAVLTTLVSQDRVYVYFEADEATFLRYARDGRRPQALPVRVGLVGEEGFPHAGRVDFVDNQMARSTGTIVVRAVLDNAGRRFTPGLFARVRLPGGDEAPAMLIDEKAVLTDQDRKYVWIVGADGRAERRDLRLGRSVEIAGAGPGRALRVVEQGLAAGDRVVVDGVMKIFAAGMPVDAKAVAMAPAAASN